MERKDEKAYFSEKLNCLFSSAENEIEAINADSAHAGAVLGDR